MNRKNEICTHLEYQDEDHPLVVFHVPRRLPLDGWLRIVLLMMGTIEMEVPKGRRDTWRRYVCPQHRPRHEIGTVYPTVRIESLYRNFSVRKEQSERGVDVRKRESRILHLRWSMASQIKGLRRLRDWSCYLGTGVAKRLELQLLGNVGNC